MPDWIIFLFQLLALGFVGLLFVMFLAAHTEGEQDGEEDCNSFRRF